MHIVIDTVAVANVTTTTAPGIKELRPDLE